MYIAAAITAAVVFVCSMPWFRSKVQLAGEHVIITGGSEGLGFCLAKEFCEKKCRVTIIARTKSKLDQALNNLQEMALPEVQVQALTADVTQNEQMQEAVQQAQAIFGPCDIMVCNAGATQPGRVEDLPVSAFERLMTINYLGVVHSIKAVLPSMLQRHHGHLVFISSSMGLIGFTGYAAYAPTKYAVKGLADTLRNELQATGVGISIGFPADMSTDSYAQEELIKPEGCKAVSKAFGSVYKPEQVAKGFVCGLEKGKYHLPTPDIGQDWFIMDGTASWSPRSLPLLLSCVLAPVVPIAMYVCTKVADRIVRKQRQRTVAASS